MVIIQKNDIKYLYVDILKHRAEVKVIDNNLTMRLCYYGRRWVYTGLGWK